MVAKKATDHNNQWYDQQQHQEEAEKGFSPTAAAAGQLTTSAELKNIFEASFPHHLYQQEIVHAFGYGSGVFDQQQQHASTTTNNSGVASRNGNEHDGDEDENPEPPPPQQQEEKKMLDMILIVNDATRFHSINSNVNPHHYAPLFRNSPSRAAWWQQHTLPPQQSFLRNPKVFFNFVDEEPTWMKYGIITRADLASDLRHWDSLYVGGRMHKPTATIVHRAENGDMENDVLQLQTKYNLPAALSTALLLLSSSAASNQNNNESTIITLPALYSQISALSYTGDFRMQVGAEDPGKINKLVHSPGQLGRFHELYYESALQPLIHSGVLSISNEVATSSALLENKVITWNASDPSALQHIWERLPPRLQLLQPPSSYASQSQKAKTTQLAIQTELHKIVAPAARYQSFKGLSTAGMTKSAKYALSKLSKGILRRG